MGLVASVDRWGVCDLVWEVMLLPETGNKVLPDTVEESELATK